MGEVRKMRRKVCGGMNKKENERDGGAEGRQRERRYVGRRMG